MQVAIIDTISATVGRKARLAKLFIEATDVESSKVLLLNIPQLL